MSRCFPFPPPGYGKTRTVDTDLLKKEKHKEKQHKQEKKDTDRKDKKEKRDKNRSEEKHREKKSKKEKHREKKKDKGKVRDKDTDKTNVVGEKKFLVQNDSSNADKPTQKEQKHKDKSSVSSEEKFSRQHARYIGEKIRQSSHLVEESKDYKFVQEFDRRIKHDAGGGGTQMVHKVPVMGHKNDEATSEIVAMGNFRLPDCKEKVKGIDTRKSNGHGSLVDARPSGNTVVQNHVGNCQPRIEGLPKTLEKKSEKMQERKEAINLKKDDTRGEKRKDRDKEKKGHGKDKDRDKEKKKEKEKEQLVHKNSQHIKLKESNEVDPFHTNSFSKHPRESIANAVLEENGKKRKNIESNGVLNVNNNWPNKLPRPSSHPLSENGRKPEPNSISVHCASDSRQGVGDNLKVDKKDRKKNGIIEVPPFSVPSSETVRGSTLPNQVAGVSVKSPHPDTKYLKQVYSVPQMETWSESDDQEWLFTSSSSELSKQKVESSGTGELPQVWAEALQIEQADVCALPNGCHSMSWSLLEMQPDGRGKLTALMLHSFGSQFPSRNSSE